MIAAPASRTIASATSAKTRKPRLHGPSRPAVTRPPPCPRSSGAGGALARRKAGTTPKRSTATTVAPSAAPSAARLVPTSWARGRVSAASRSSRRVPAAPSSAPTAPPRTARTRLSVTSCRASRPREAPSAPRRPSSCARAPERARSRPAVLAQVTRRRVTTAARSTRSGRRTSPTSHLLERRRAGAHQPVGFGIAALETRRDGGELGVGRGDRDAGPQTGQAVQEVRATEPHLAGGAAREFRRHPDVEAGPGEGEAARRHPDDRARFAVELDAAPQDARGPPRSGGARGRG